ncbi:mechanosensitive ion channel family protein [Flammeovirga sp. EKP202]|uniref:mechanosensitive ion channel family protein n=1 Tax=Flammeovirga sp. EKP202 TaxID=2770592 RepID=UPI00165EFBE6|nr:mechanosensitive ion channel family protein [Flammeovirga sp. EKP202]MBD0404292.1 mechanosensitive ion channel family protein [Flammeovirga sp. EKP202]
MKFKKIILFVLSFFTLALISNAQNTTIAKEQLQMYKEIQSLIVADSIYRDFLRRQLSKLDSLSNKGVKKKAKFLVKGKPVIPFEDTLFFVHRRNNISALQRATTLSDSIVEIAENTLYLIDSVELQIFDTNYQLVYQEIVLHTIDSIDASLSSMSTIELAKFRQEKINHALRDKINYQGQVSGIIALIGLVILMILIVVINRVYKVTMIKVIRDEKGWFRSKTVKNVRILTEENQILIARYILAGIRIAFIVILVSLYLPIVGRFSPPLRDFSDEVFGYIIDPFVEIIYAIIAYTPSLLKIIVIILVFHFTIRIIKTFAKAIAEGRLKIHGFYPDWVPPTLKIIKFVLYTFMVIMIFPLLPGAESQEFRGISVFVGVLLSIGSTSVITNAISGIVITYMRRFKIGDWIKINDVMGEVVERSLFVTRLKSSKNEIITIPNSKISESNTINYSQPINRYKLIIHTTVTIGYDVPWRKVHAMLKEAAEMTEGLIAGEIPYVLQTSLDDYYVSYQLNAHTRQPQKIPRIYSKLHQNIQDIFAREKVEIMSPHYRANREDNEITIPDYKLMKDEEVPETKNTEKDSDKDTDK